MERFTNPDQTDLILSALADREATGGGAITPFLDIGKKERFALSFIVRDHTDLRMVFNMFTDCLVAWIDLGMLEHPSDDLANLPGMSDSPL